jgi:hypothetical protein
MGVKDKRPEIKKTIDHEKDKQQVTKDKRGETRG